MSELYDHCYICDKEIAEGENCIATDDVTCEIATKGEPFEYMPWDNNPYRGIYCTECWEDVASAIFHLTKKRQGGTSC